MNKIRVRTRSGTSIAVAASVLIAGLAANTLWSSDSNAHPANGLAIASALGGGRVEFADLIEQVSPAVVNIAVEKTVRPASFEGRNPFSGTPFEHFFGPQGPRNVPERRAGGLGSGFIIDADGYIVTNHHVVDGAEDITVTLTDGEQHPAKVVGVDPNTDLALLKVDSGQKLPFVPFGDSDRARVGEWVVAIGNPFGLGGSATAGIISARGRDINAGPYDDYLQIDAPINSGNSGGPVFNTAGEVIGVNTAIFSPNGGSVGIGFAIPASQVSTVVNDLREHGEVRRGWLGVEIQRVDKDIAESLGLDSARGALIAGVNEDSPAEGAGIRVGDVILGYAGQQIDDPKDLSRAVAATDAGDKARLEVWRDGKSKTLSVRVGERDDQLLSGVGSGQPDGDLGLSLAPLDRQTRERYEIARGVEGVVVTDVREGSAAARRGLRPGDVISMLNQREIRSLGELREELATARADQRGSVLALVRRGDNRRFVTLGLG